MTSNYYKILTFLLCSLCCWLAFPNKLLHLPLLGAVIPSLVTLVAVQEKTPHRAFCFAFFSGMFGYGAALYWVAVPIHDFGYMPWLIALPFPLLLGAYVALYLGLFGLGIYFYSSKLLPPFNSNFSVANPRLFDLLKLGIFAGALWALLEYLRGWLFTGFPWLSLSSAFAPWPWAIQGLSALGVYGLSGLYAFIGTGIALSIAFFIEREHKEYIIPALPLLGLVGLCLLFLCIWSLAAFSPKATFSKAMGVVLVQGNIDQDQKWNPEYQARTLSHYIRLTRQALRQIDNGEKHFDQIAASLTPPYEPPVRLIVWPETAMPFFYSRSGELGEDIRAMVRQEAVHLLFGAPEMERSPGKTAIYNRAYLLDPAGRTLNYYDKEHLVPFGEYAPSWLRIPILEFLLEQVGNLDPGTHTAPLRISTPVWEARIGMLICYEAIFPELARKRVADGSNIFLTISNDAWFGDTAAPEQHLQLAAMRAVEQGKWLVRATNTGISTIIDQHGQRRVQSGLFTTETLSALAYTQEGTTLFYLIGPYLPYLLIFTLALLLISGYIERRKT